MKTAGLVAEFNPFHYGHKYIIDKIKNEYGMDSLIVAMSPDFVMRGEPAVFDKFTRTRIALENGVNLVAEIPTIYTLESADIYAYRAVEILGNLGITDLFFGAETDNLNLLNEIGLLEESDAYREELKRYQSMGNSFSSSSKLAITYINKEYGEILKGSNNLLAIEYLKAIRKLGLHVTPHIIKRIDTGYYDELNENSLIQSATYLRKTIENSTVNPAFFPYDLKSIPKVVKNDCFEYLKYRIISSSEEDLREIQGINEGLENKIKSVKEFTTYENLVNELSSRRNRPQKISRILMCILLNIKKREISAGRLEYVRILGFDSTGQLHLKNLKSTCVIYSVLKKGLVEAVYRELDFAEVYRLISPIKGNFVSEYEPIRI